MLNPYQETAKGLDFRNGRIHEKLKYDCLADHAEASWYKPNTKPYKPDVIVPLMNSHNRMTGMHRFCKWVFERPKDFPA